MRYGLFKLCGDNPGYFTGMSDDQLEIADTSACEQFVAQQWTNPHFTQRLFDMIGFENTPILEAIASGRKKLAQLIAIEMITRNLTMIDIPDADPDGGSGNTPLLLAIKMGYEELALTLLASNEKNPAQPLVDIHRRFHANFTYLHFASVYRLDKVIAKLIEQGIDQTLVNDYGALAIDYRRYQFRESDVYGAWYLGARSTSKICDGTGISYHLGRYRALNISPFDGELSIAYIQFVVRSEQNLLERALHSIQTRGRCGRVVPPTNEHHIDLIQSLISRAKAVNNNDGMISELDLKQSLTTLRLDMAKAILELNALALVSPTVTVKASKIGINMHLLSGFITAMGVASVAIAFIALNATTFGFAGLVVAAIGLTATFLGGIGLFKYASGTSRGSSRDGTSFPIMPL